MSGEAYGQIFRTSAMALRISLTEGSSMLIVPTDINRARQAAKSLKSNLDSSGIKRPLTWHQDTVAAMLGHANWKLLAAALNAGTAPSTPDEDETISVVEMRRKAQLDVLDERLGGEVSSRGLSRDFLALIVRHVAVSGRPTGGSAFQEFELEITDRGIELPFSVEYFTEDALLHWDKVTKTNEFEYITRQFDPELDEFLGLLDDSIVPEFDPQHARHAMSVLNAGIDDRLDHMVLLSYVTRLSGDLENAREVITDAYNLGSYAWANVARERRRRHDPVRWWNEECTRPMMRVLREKAIVDLLSGTDVGARSWFKMFQVIYALNPTDPLGVGKHLTDAVNAAQGRQGTE